MRRPGPPMSDIVVIPRTPSEGNASWPGFYAGRRTYNVPVRVLSTARRFSH